MFLMKVLELLKEMFDGEIRIIECDVLYVCVRLVFCCGMGGRVLRWWGYLSYFFGEVVVCSSDWSFCGFFMFVVFIMRV